MGLVWSFLSFIGSGIYRDWYCLEVRGFVYYVYGKGRGGRGGMTKKRSIIVAGKRKQEIPAW